VRVSVVQLSPGHRKRDNIDQARRVLEETIALDRPDLVVLPEIWTCLGGTRSDKFEAAEILPDAEDGDGGGEAYSFLREVALANRIHVHGGSIGERAGERLFNTSLVFDPDGRRIATYRKIHLFDIVTPSGEGYKESDTYRAGEEIVTVPLGGVFDGLRLGLAICYDLRFGELFHRLRNAGAELIALPAAFTAETGEAHWDALVRARAIEFQCWVAASGTTGRHKDASGQDRMTYGHSMIVDPWGTVVGRASGGVSSAAARINRERTAVIRAGMPVMDHRRIS
jgi:deaminated glutathione amidase